MNTLFINAKHLSRLTFWRITAFLIDRAVRHKNVIHRIWPYLPLIAYGSGAYAIGLIIGGIVKALFL
jgi:hypothetical protein